MEVIAASMFSTMSLVGVPLETSFVPEMNADMAKKGYIIMGVYLANNITNFGITLI